MTASAQTAGLLDIQRIRNAIDKVLELQPLVEATMRAADGSAWMDARRARLKRRGINVRKDQRLSDQRVLLAIIAEEQALRSVFSEAEQTMAARLRQLANAAFHNDCTSLASDDATWAETSMHRLLQVGRAAMAPRETAGPDVHGWMRRSHDAAREQEAEEAHLAHQAMERRADYFERAWWLNRTIATFQRLMEAAGNPGVERVGPRPQGLLQLLTARRGWTLAYRHAFGRHGVPRELQLVLTTTGKLLLCGTDPDSGRLVVDERVRIDPRRPRTWVVRSGWSVETGETAYVGQRTSSAIPFATGWTGGLAEKACSLEEAVAARVGELCVTHALSWPDDDREAAAQLEQERIAFLRNPSALGMPSFALQRTLATALQSFGPMRRPPIWLALPLVVLLPWLLALVALFNFARFVASFLGLTYEDGGGALGWFQRQPSVVQGCLLFIAGWVVLALVLETLLKALTGTG